MVYDWLAGLTTPEHRSEWVNGITGAFGAMLGSLVTVAWTAWYSRRTRYRERREKFAAGAFAAYQRLNQIYSIALMIRDHINEGQEKARQSGMPPCAVTMGLQRMSGPVTFPLEELWTLTQVGGIELVNIVNSLDHSFNQLLDVMDRYSNDRREVWSKFPPPERMDGNMGQVSLTSEQVRALAPFLEELNLTLRQSGPISVGIVTDTFTALRLLVHAPTRPLGKKFKLLLPDPDHAAVEIRAQDAPKRRWRTRHFSNLRRKRTQHL